MNIQVQNTEKSIGENLSGYLTSVLDSTDFVDKESKDNFICAEKVLNDIYNKEGINGIVELFSGSNDLTLLYGLIQVSETIVDDILKILGIEGNQLIIKDINRKVSAVLSMKNAKKIGIDISSSSKVA